MSCGRNDLVRVRLVGNAWVCSVAGFVLRSVGLRVVMHRCAGFRGAGRRSKVPEVCGGRRRRRRPGRARAPGRRRRSAAFARRAVGRRRRVVPPAFRARPRKAGVSGSSLRSGGTHGGPCGRAGAAELAELPPCVRAAWCGGSSRPEGTPAPRRPTHGPADTRDPPPPLGAVAPRRAAGGAVTGRRPPRKATDGALSRCQGPGGLSGLGRRVRPADGRTAILDRIRAPRLTQRGSVAYWNA